MQRSGVRRMHDIFHLLLQVYPVELVHILAGIRDDAARERRYPGERRRVLEDDGALRRIFFHPLQGAYIVRRRLLVWFAVIVGSYNDRRRYDEQDGYHCDDL